MSQTIALRRAKGSLSELTGRRAVAPPRHMPLRGIALIAAASAFFSCADVVTKALAATLPAIEIAWLRYVTFSLIAIPLLFATAGRAGLHSTRPALQTVRGLGIVGSALLITLSLRFLPVADATAVYFISPILITALSIPFLGETVGWRRWTAALVGLLGVVIVVRPGTAAFEMAALLPLLGASSWAGSVIVTRMMSGTDQPLTTLAYSAAVGTVVLTAMLPFVWQVPEWQEIALGICVGVLSTTGHWLIILAYRYAPASAISPFSYVQLIWSGLLGYAVFRSVPDSWTVAGAAIIAASGLYTAYRERVRATQIR